MDERALLEAFIRELPAYKANRSIYMLDRVMNVWDEVLPNIYKYVLCVDRDKIQLWLNLELDMDLNQNLIEGGRKEPKR